MRSQAILALAAALYGLGYAEPIPAAASKDTTLSTHHPVPTYGGPGHTDKKDHTAKTDKPGHMTDKPKHDTMSRSCTVTMTATPLDKDCTKTEHTMTSTTYSFCTGCAEKTMTPDPTAVCKEYKTTVPGTATTTETKCLRDKPMTPGADHKPKHHTSKDGEHETKKGKHETETKKHETETKKHETETKKHETETKKPESETKKGEHGTKTKDQKNTKTDAPKPDPTA